MIALLAALLSAGQSSDTTAGLYDQVTAEVAAERVSQCGLGPVTVRYEDELQSEVLTAAPSSLLTDDQLRCADRAASYFDLELPVDSRARYDSIRNTRLAAYFLGESRAWLAARGLLERVPQYRAGVTDEATFTREVETLCGSHAAGAFQSSFGFHVLDPDWVRRELPIGNPGEDVFACLMKVTRVAGFEVGFVGNEALSR